MANLTAKGIKSQQQFGGVPYGNVSAIKTNITTDASGIWTNGNGTAAVAISDVLRPCILPAGMRLDDMIATISDAFTASSTFMIGFAYVDGVDSTAVPQDADYFCAATTAASTAIIRKTNVTAPVVLPKDAYLTVTNAGAAQAAVGVMDVVVLGDMLGAP